LFKIKIYPNPVSTELTIEVEGNNKIINYEILNSIGQVVVEGNLLEKTTVPISYLTSGFYFVKLEIGNTYKFKKIIKE
ncbi:MAG: T9SS type A sorting domain-containing protein, partial [Draconibacterium sp.]|nr:T9SS type A sorting domain-containing protein [Draconibacterium sp.]